MRAGTDAGHGAGPVGAPGAFGPQHHSGIASDGIAGKAAWRTLVTYDGYDR